MLTNPGGKEVDVHVRFERIWSLNPQQVDLIEADWAAAHDLSSVQGTEALIREATELAVDLGEVLADARTGQERALAVLIDHPDVFDRAHAFVTSDSAAGSRWYRCSAEPNLPVNRDASHIANFEKLLQEHFRRDGRGRNCRVEYFQRSSPERHCFFAYPEDHPVGEICYDEQGSLHRRTRRPAFEVAFVYRPTEGAIEVLVPGGKRSGAKLAAIFSAVVLGPDDGPDERNRPAVDLDMFRDRRVQLPTDPRDHVVAVHVAEIGFDVSGSASCVMIFRQKAREHDPLALYDAVEAAGESGTLDFTTARVRHVTLRVVIRPPDAIKAKSVRFSLHAPDRCTLGDRRYDQLLRDYLVRWNVLVSATARVEAA